MRTLDEIMALLTGPAILDELKDLIRAHDESFPHEEALYQEAVSDLKAFTNEEEVNEYIEACEKVVIGNILYAAYEGYRANLQNFYAPYPTNFPQMDFTHYIRDHLIERFQPVIEASRIRDDFARRLPEGCDDAEYVVTNYFSLLEVYGPKVAHYVGYMLANKLLVWVVPGYRADYSQTSLYRTEFKKYFDFLPE